MLTHISGVGGRNQADKEGREGAGEDQSVHGDALRLSGRFRLMRIGERMGVGFGLGAPCLKRCSLPVMGRTTEMSKL